jgi:hypothetical protein
VKNSLLCLLFCCAIAGAQEVDQLSQFMEKLQKNEAEVELMDAALECAAIADIAAWNTAESTRLKIVALNVGKEVLSTAYKELFVFPGEWPTIPINPVTGKLFDKDVDSAANLLGFSDLTELAVFMVGQSFGEERQSFFDDIPYGGSSEMWKINIEAEFNRRNCALVGL